MNKEQAFIECMLNMKYSGCDIILPFIFYAFQESWHIDKLIYYSNLLELE